MIELYSAHSSDGSHAALPSTQLAQQKKKANDDDEEGAYILLFVVDCLT